MPSDLYFKHFPLVRQQQNLIIIHLHNWISEQLYVPGVSNLLHLTSLLPFANAQEQLSLISFFSGMYCDPKCLALQIYF